MSTILSAQVQNAMSPVTALEQMQAIEKLGGSAAYLKHLEQAVFNGPNPQIASKPTTTAAADAVICGIELGSVLVFTWGKIVAVNGWSVEIKGWGPGLQYSHLAGYVLCTSWEELTAGECDFVAFAGGATVAGITIIFTRNGNWVGQAFGAGEGYGGVYFQGSCKWEH